ncbi:MAG: hypothetical protein RIF32_16550 [Leptospirales bacterium]|jgi:DNA polymerase III delta subunit
MEVKDLASFQKGLDKLDLESPGVLMVSGTDTAAADTVIDRLRARLQKEIGNFETILFSGESGDDERFIEEIANVPLFAPYRFILVRQAEELFKTPLASKARYAGYLEAFANPSPRTAIFIVYGGSPSQKLVKLFHPAGLLHFVTRELFSNQISDQIRTIAKRVGLNLGEEAVHLVRESVEPKSGSIEQMMQRLRDTLPEELRERPVSLDAIREVLFPGQGVNAFAFVDALFALDHRSVEREFIHFNPANDNFFSILKIMLNRTDEIRKARIGIGMGMQDGELIDFLGLKGRPPFIQKKILSRLKMEVNTFSPSRLEAVYEMLIEIQNEFRSNVPTSRHSLIFQRHISDVFFSAAANAR